MSEVWTIPALKEHLESRIEGVQASARLALDAAERAADKADKAFEKRMDSVNEFRAVLTDQQTTFVTKGQVKWAITAFFLALGAATAIFAALSRV